MYYKIFRKVVLKYDTSIERDKKLNLNCYKCIADCLVHFSLIYVIALCIRGACRLTVNRRQSASNGKSSGMDLSFRSSLKLSPTAAAFPEARLIVQLGSLSLFDLKMQYRPRVNGLIARQMRALTAST